MTPIGTPKKLLRDKTSVFDKHNSEKLLGRDEACCGSTTPNFCIVSEKVFLESKNSAKSFVSNLDNTSDTKKSLEGEIPQEKFCFASSFDTNLDNF